MQTQTKLEFGNLTEFRTAISQLDTAVERPVYAYENSKIRKIDDFKAIYNADKKIYVSVPGKNYTLMQHQTAFETFVPAAEAFGKKLTGWISQSNDGGRARVSVFFPDLKIVPFDGHEISIGFTAINSYDGSSSLKGQVFGYRSFCKNGMIFGKQLQFAVTKMHKGEMTAAIFENLIQHSIETIPALKEAIEGASIEYLPSAPEELQKLLVTQYRYGKRQAKKIISEHMIETDNGKVSRWNLYNAVTHWVSHSRQSMDTQTYQLEKAEKILIHIASMRNGK